MSIMTFWCTEKSQFMLQTSIKPILIWSLSRFKTPVTWKAQTVHDATYVSVHVWTHVPDVLASVRAHGWASQRAWERAGERVSVRASVRVSEAHVQASTHARKQEYANVRTSVWTCTRSLLRGCFWKIRPYFPQNHPLKVSEQGGRGIERVRKWDTHPLAHTYVRMHVRSLTRSLTRTLTRSLRSLARTLTRSPARSLARSLAHPCVSWRSPGSFGT